MTAENTTPDPAQAAAVPGKPAMMPLGARRQIMIGGLCVPVGLVGGPYLLGAQLLAVTGVILVAVALSYSAETPWFSRLSWVVTGAGALWLATTAAYWGSIITAADSSAPAPGYAPALFNAGTGSFIVMACAAVAAIALRMVRARRQPVRTT